MPGWLNCSDCRGDPKGYESHYCSATVPPQLLDLNGTLVIYWGTYVRVCSEINQWVRFYYNTISTTILFCSCLTQQTCMLENTECETEINCYIYNWLQ